MIKIWFSNNQLATDTWSLKNCSSRWNLGISLNPCCNPVCWFIWEVAINNYCEICHMQLNCMEVCVNRTIILEPPKQIITWSELGSKKNSWGSTGVLLVKTPVSCERGALDEILMVCTIIIIIAYEYSLESVELDAKETCTKKIWPRKKHASRPQDLTLPNFLAGFLRLARRTKWKRDYP